MSLDTYQHVMDELDGAERVPADEQIRRARAELVPVSYPLRVTGVPSRTLDGPNRLQMRPSPPSDSNRKPLHYKPKTGVDRLRTPACAST